MNKPDIAIIINSFNRLELLKQCLEVLCHWVPESEFNERCVAVIFDAGSTDGSIQWLQNAVGNLEIPCEIVIPEPEEDNSFAAGINTGSSYAKSKFPTIRYFLFYETDNQILEARSLSNALLELEKRPFLGACGFTVRQHNGLPAGVGMPFPALFNFAVGKNIVHKFQLEAINYNWQLSDAGCKFSEIDIAFTSPLLVKFDAWNESGGFDAKTFPFSDSDIDWARRLKNAGWQMGVIESDAVIHDNFNAISSWSKSRAMQFHRGRLRYFKRYNPVTVYCVWPVALLVRHAFEILAVALFVKDKARREHLVNQFGDLFKHCLNGYE